MLLVVTVAQASGVSTPQSDTLSPLMLVPFIAGSILDTTPAGSGANPPWDVIRAELNKVIADFAYAALNKPRWQVAAAAVAPPVCATGGTTSKVKTTATTQCEIDGVLISLTGTDDLWVLTADAANTLAIGYCRRYQLLWDGASGTTTVSVKASNDKSIAASALGTAASALAACRWPGLPAKSAAGNSQVIVGVLSIANVTNVFIPGTTLLGAAGVTATYRDGPDAACFEATPVTP
jgi:hypothetical protein